MRISYWSSYLCSSDLVHSRGGSETAGAAVKRRISAGIFLRKTGGYTRTPFSIDGRSEHYAGKYQGALYNLGEWAAPCHIRSGVGIGQLHSSKIFAQIGRAYCRERVCKYV